MSGRIKAKETGFFAVFVGCNASSQKKTRFLTTRAIANYMKFIGIDLGCKSLNHQPHQTHIKFGSVGMKHLGDNRSEKPDV